MNPRNIVHFVALVLATTSLSCSRNDPGEGTGAALPRPDEHGALPAEGHVEDAETQEVSDLDRSVEELATLVCEHSVKTYECPECRYEVGFVHAPASLVEGGLITTVKVEHRNVAVPIALTGEVGFDERRVGHVSSQVEGVISKVHVALGERVRKGQPLFEIESIAVGEAQAALLEAQSLLQLARRNFERVSGLRTENISSEKEFLQAKQEFETAEIRAQGALGKLTRLGTDPDEARALTSDNSRGRLDLRAPVDGAVLVLHAVPGEVARTDESLVTVGDNSTVWIWADLYERDIAAVQRGQTAGKLPAAVSVKAYPGEEFAGTVDLVSPAMDESSRTVKVRIEVKNPDGRLLPGMFAAVNLFLSGPDQTLAVPRNAVLEDEGRFFVFVHHQGEYYVRRPVEVGRAWAGWFEITEGLAPAQTVVADGSFLLKSDVLRSKMGAGCAD